MAAKWLAAAPSHRVVVNRDTIRYRMFKKFEGMDRSQEKRVTTVERKAAERALSKRKSVLIDATNLNDRHVDIWREVAKAAGAKFREVAVKTPLEECLRRNAERGARGGRRVPDRIIYEMNAKALCLRPS